jgi:hypothetical protein
VRGIPACRFTLIAEFDRSSGFPKSSERLHQAKSQRVGETGRCTEPLADKLSSPPSVWNPYLSRVLDFVAQAHRGGLRILSPRRWPRPQPQSPRLMVSTVCRVSDGRRLSAFSFGRSESKTSVQAVSRCQMYPRQCLPLSLFIGGNGNYPGYPCRSNRETRGKILSWFRGFRLAL